MVGGVGGLQGTLAEFHCRRCGLTCTKAEQDFDASGRSASPGCANSLCANKGKRTMTSQKLNSGIFS
jgi:hypothetical protein